LRDENNIITDFITDQSSIEKECNKYYQNAGVNDLNASSHTYNDLMSLPQEWQPFYEPKNFPFQSHIDNMNKPILMEELQTAIQFLPTRKAASPSKVTYEDIKYLDTTFKELILTMFNYITTSA